MEAGTGIIEDELTHRWRQTSGFSVHEEPPTLQILNISSILPKHLHNIVRFVDGEKTRTTFGHVATQ